jgi:uncharacterized membrane protein
MARTNAASTIISVVVILLLVGGVVAGLVYLYLKVPAPVSALLGASAGFVVTKFYESLKEGRARLHDKKRDVYHRLLQPFFKLHMQIVRGGEVPAHEVIVTEMGEAMVEATFDAVLYASDDVLKLYAQMREESDGVKILVLYMRLLRAIRKDLGHSVTSITDSDILRLFVNFKGGELEHFRQTSASM